MSHYFKSIWFLAGQRGIQPQEARKSRRAFRKWVQGLGQISPQQFMKSYAKGAGRTESGLNLKTNSPLNVKSIGKMYLYGYDPKHKDKLPYYDTFPLIFVVGPAKGGFYGINFHYLPIPYRIMLMDALYGIMNNNKYDDTTRIKMTYRVLKSASKYKWFLPCFKHYLVKHVRTPFHLIEAKNWEMALMLPVARWKKKPASFVHTDSLKRVRNAF